MPLNSRTTRVAEPADGRGDLFFQFAALYFFQLPAQGISFVQQGRHLQRDFRQGHVDGMLQLAADIVFQLIIAQGAIAGQIVQADIGANAFAFDYFEQANFGAVLQMGAAACRLLQSRYFHHADFSLALGRLAQVQGGDVVAFKNTDGQIGEDATGAFQLQGLDFIVTQAPGARFRSRNVPGRWRRKGSGR